MWTSREDTSSPVRATSSPVRACAVQSRPRCSLCQETPLPLVRHLPKHRIPHPPPRPPTPLPAPSPRMQVASALAIPCRIRRPPRTTRSRCVYAGAQLHPCPIHVSLGAEYSLPHSHARPRVARGCTPPTRRPPRRRHTTRRHRLYRGGGGRTCQPTPTSPAGGHDRRHCARRVRLRQPYCSASLTPAWRSPFQHSRTASSPSTQGLPPLHDVN